MSLAFLNGPAMLASLRFTCSSTQPRMGTGLDDNTPASDNGCTPHAEPEALYVEGAVSTEGESLFPTDDRAQEIREGILLGLSAPARAAGWLHLTSAAGLEPKPPVEAGAAAYTVVNGYRNPYGRIVDWVILGPDGTALAKVTTKRGALKLIDLLNRADKE